MQNQLVSIIIPTYNRAHLIGETLDSVLAQTYNNWECIVVDDGSTDHTDQVLREFCEKDARFQYHHRPKDRLPGGNAARNYGFEVSKGEYIQWFDSDDLMLPNHLEKKIDIFIKSQCNLDYVYSGFLIFSKLNKIKYKNLTKEDDLIKGLLNKKIVFQTASFMYNRTSISHFSYTEFLTRAQDLDFVFRFVTDKIRKGDNVNSVLFRVREHEDSITGNYLHKKCIDLNSEMKVLKKIYKYVFKNYKKDIISISRNSILNLMKMALQNKCKKLFFKHVLISNEINILLKLKLVFIGVIYLITGKGLYRIKKI